MGSKRKKSAQIISDDGTKLCFRHDRYFPDEEPWRDLEEFWKHSKQDTGLASNCRRCKKIHRAKRENGESTFDTEYNFVPGDKRIELHTYVHQDTRKMLQHFRNKHELRIGAVVDKALKVYLTEQIRQEMTNAT